MWWWSRWGPHPKQLPSQVKGRVSERGWKNSQDCFTSRVSRFHWGSSKQPDSRYVSVCSIKKKKKKKVWPHPVPKRRQGSLELWFGLRCSTKKPSDKVGRVDNAITGMDPWRIKSRDEQLWMKDDGLKCSGNFKMPLIVSSPFILGFRPGCCRSWFSPDNVNGRCCAINKLRQTTCIQITSFKISPAVRHSWGSAVAGAGWHFGILPLLPCCVPSYTTGA